MTRFNSRLAVVAAMAVMAGLSPAVAQDAGSYPNQSIRILITNPPGGLPDTVARLYARFMEPKLGQSIVVENRPGANGTVAVGAMLAAPANGYTLIVTDGGIYASNPALYPGLSYSEKDLKPVALMARAPLFLTVHPKVPVKTLDEFIAYARANPGKLNYGSSGVGSVHHLGMVALGRALNLDMVHVPFKGTGESVPALLGGHIDLLYSAFPSLSGAANTKQVLMLAANSLQRSTLAPDLPAISERVPGYDYAPSIGLYGKTGMPDAAVQKLASLIMEVSKNKEIIDRFFALGTEATAGGADQFETLLKAESVRIRELVKAANIQMKQ